MFVYDFDRLNDFLKRILQKHITPETQTWLEDAARAAAAHDMSKFNIAFVAMPRRTGKKLIEISSAQQEDLRSRRKDFNISGWTADRLARVWLLMQLNPADKSRYHAAAENLFLNAEMGELVSLYSSLPVLAYPQSWAKRCAEGIRSNIGQVLEAVICNNPFPSEQLDEAAWNQLILKAIFTDKPLLDIVGLRERRNVNLAKSLSDYAHERWAAHRDLNPLVWLCVAPFIDDHNFSDIQRLFSSADVRERDAAALVCYESAYAPAKEWLSENREIRDEIEKGEISWDKIAAKVSV